ncbi:hypothetical protein BKA62DRAFT_669316 [Auriculariales sp. MPI-PUGE-AT-0066]|nr:hypothetical protein BKA62DRAFT_669316 [Auriculariales sp. MPI-PUGE-AT-0066]
MKLSYLLTTLSVLVAGSSGASASPTEKRQAGCTGTPVPLYRAWSNDLGNFDHFYTRSLGEIINAEPGYTQEPDCCRLFADNQTSSTVPFYRLWSGDAADHFYTTSEAQRTYALSIGYVDEGVTGWVYPAALCGTVPLYRLYVDTGNGPTKKDHFYTIDAAERDYAVSQYGYTFEGIEAYVFPA